MSTKLTRRDLLRVGGAAVAGSALTRPTLARTAPDTAPAVIGSTRPRNIIFMVSDGMSMGVPTMAESFSKLTRGRDTAWSQLMRHRETVSGLLATESLSAAVTDSSAASSAWGSGRRVSNGAVNTYPDGTRLTPIAEMAKERGVRVGLVVTDHICGGTPCGFAAVQPRRSMRDEIALDYLDRVDVLLGGGRNSFDPRRRDDEVDLIERYKDHGYAYSEDRAGVVNGSTAKKLLGLFSGDVLPYTIDQAQDNALRERVPTLAEMTRTALRCLHDSPRGFFLMVEGARIDHAAHANDAAAMLHDQLAFDDAVSSALDYAQKNRDTLIVISSDHGNANPGLNGVGSGYRSSAERFARLANFKASISRVIPRIRAEGAACGDVVCAAENAFRELLGLELTPEEARIVGQAVIEGELPHELADHHRNRVGVLGQIIGNYIGVGWCGVSHTSDHVILSAFGPGGGEFGRLMHHVDAHALFADMLRLESRNPTYEEAAA